MLGINRFCPGFYGRFHRFAPIVFTFVDHFELLRNGAFPSHLIGMAWTHSIAYAEYEMDIITMGLLFYSASRIFKSSEMCALLLKLVCVCAWIYIHMYCILYAMLCCALPCRAVLYVCRMSECYIIQLPQEFQYDPHSHRMQIHLFIHKKIPYIIIETDMDGKSAYFLFLVRFVYTISTISTIYWTFLSSTCGHLLSEFTHTNTRTLIQLRWI